MAERQTDLELLRKAFGVARRSRDAGDHPFGSILAGPDGAVLREQANGYQDRGRRPHRPFRAPALLLGRQDPRIELPLALYAVHFGRALRDVRGRDLLGGHRPRRLRPEREEPQGADRRPRREPDPRPALPARVRSWAAADGGRRAVAGRGSGEAAGGFLAVFCTDDILPLRPDVPYLGAIAHAEAERDQDQWRRPSARRRAICRRPPPA